MKRSSISNRHIFLFSDQCENKIGGGLCGYLLRRKLIQCKNEKDIGEQFQQKCPFSCQSCKNPGTRKHFL